LLRPAISRHIIRNVDQSNGRETDTVKGRPSARRERLESRISAEARGPKFLAGDQTPGRFYCCIGLVVAARLAAAIHHVWLINWRAIGAVSLV
jgi:hypothetical protein